jgi:hypothetical protein
MVPGGVVPGGMVPGDWGHADTDETGGGGVF